MEYIKIAKVDHPEEGIQVIAKYDENLIKEIKAIDKSKRKYNPDTKHWLIIDLSLLEDVRRFCERCAEKRGWEVIDLTLIDAVKASELVAVKQKEEYESSVVEIIKIIKELPPYTLKLVNWKKESISLQMKWVGEEGRDTFLTLKQCSQKAWKKEIISSEDRKMSYGFVFEVPADERIIATLLSAKVEYLKAFEFTDYQRVADEVFHAKLDGVDFIAIDHRYLDLSKLSVRSDWFNMAKIEKTLYWVCETQKYVESYLKEPAHHISRFSSGFGVFIPKEATLIPILEQLKLKDWFKNWASNLLMSESLTQAYPFVPGQKWRGVDFNHPADMLIAFVQKFNSNETIAIIGEEFYHERIQVIKKAKTDAAKAKIDEVRANVGQLAANYLQLHPKTKLVEMANKQGIQVKKSWTKEKLIDLLTQDQEKSEAIIGLT